MKKIKIFLGGYINTSNAQNLNCLALARYLDSEKFDIISMSLYSGNLTISDDIKKRIKILNCFKPFKLSRKINYFLGILLSDIVYLPKGEDYKFTRFLINLFNKKSFNTMEGIYDTAALENGIKHYGSYDNAINFYNSYENLYSITNFMKEYNKKHLNINSKDKILYLGTEIDTFLNENKKVSELKNVLIIGNDLIRKGVEDYFKLANEFQNINFHIVGSGNGKIDVSDKLKKENIKNITYHGTQTHKEIVELLKIIDLHIFPSHSEGFPKVTLETAASGVPSLVYSDYGASEWIKDHHDGFVVDNLDEMKKIIKELQNNPTLLQECSKNAISLAKRFDWKILVKDWEEEIINIIGNK